MKKIVLLLMILVWVSSAGWATETPTITTLMNNGPSGNRVNIVFLSEAYVASQRETFFDDVNMAVEEMFKRTPFKEYRNFINVHAVWVASKDSVVSVVPDSEIGDTPWDPLTWKTRTYFGKWKDIGYSLVKIDNVARSFFGPRDPIVAVLLINDDQVEGGGGQPEGVSLIGIVDKGTGRLHHDPSVSQKAYANMVAHEFGHALALKDETKGLVAMKPGQTELNLGGPFINVTTETRRDRIRWKHWIDPSVPIPTPIANGYIGKIGLFDGANYYASGWYRPAETCAMGSFADWNEMPPFCAVCREALVLAIYEYVNPLAEVSTDVGEHTTTFTINPPQPVDHALQIQWLVDGSVIASGVTDLSVVDTEIGYGQHTIRVRVVDKTEFVRSDPERLLQRSLEWNVVSYPEPDFNGSGAVDFEDFFLFADAFGLARSSVTEKYDLNWDGKVDFLDFFLFADDFGKSISKKQIFEKQ